MELMNRNLDSRYIHMYIQACSQLNYVNNHTAIICMCNFCCSKDNFYYQSALKIHCRIRWGFEGGSSSQ